MIVFTLILLLASAPSNNLQAYNSLYRSSGPLQGLLSYQPYISLALDKLIFERKDAGYVTIRKDNANFIIRGTARNILEYIPSTDTLLFPKASVASKLQVSATLSAAMLSQWVLWSLSKFDVDEGTWSPAEFSRCGNSVDMFLGGHCKFGATIATRRYEQLPLHKELRITARIHFFDQWTGQSIFLKIGDKIVWTGSWNWCPKIFSVECVKHGIDICGHQYPDRLSHHLAVTVAHCDDFLDLTFGSTISKDTDPCLVSWGVDDVALYLKR